MFSDIVALKVFTLCISASDDVSRTLDAFGKTQKAQDRLVIIGGGNVGCSVAKELESGKSRVRTKVIEMNRKVAEEAAEALERTIVLNGDGLDDALQTEAGVSRADAILAVTDDEKTNMLACVRAKAKGCPMAIALINDPTLAPMMGPLRPLVNRIKLGAFEITTIHSAASRCGEALRTISGNRPS